MGLLDALFQDSNYGGQGGGLLDFLRTSQMQDQQYQPSAGFPQQQPPANFADRFNAIPGAPQPVNPQGRQFDQAAFDPQTYAPGQAQPIGIGGYQMPRIGMASDFQPQQASQQAALPPNSQPTQGQLPPTDVSAQSRQPQQQGLPPALGGNTFGGNLGAGLQSFANTPGGLIPKLLGGVSAGLTGQRTDPQGIQQQNLKAQYEAYVQSGMPRNIAMAATLNPKLLEQIGPAYFGKNEIVEGGTDPLTGKKSWVLKNSVDETVKDLSPSGNGGAAGGSQDVADRIATARAQGATRDQLLQLVPSSYRPYVDAVLQDKALPANMGRGAARMQIMGLAHAVDNNFNEENIPFRLDTRRDYSPKGKSGQSIVALNTVQHHIGQLSDALENKDLGDTGWTFLNKIRNGVAQNTPLDPKQGAAIKQVEDAMTAVEDEMANAYKAGKVSDKEIQRWHELTDPNKPLWQQKQGIKDFVGLLNGKRDQLNETHQSILGEEAPGINKELNKAITERVNARSDALNVKNNGAMGKPATVIQNGHTYTLQPDGSYK